jgi:DNA repair protein RadC
LFVFAPAQAFRLSRAFSFGDSEMQTIERTYRRMNKAIRLAQSGEADSVIAAALKILETRMRHGGTLGSPVAVREYLRLLLHDREHEVFVVVLLDAQNRVLAAEEMFRGTLSQTSVYPREIVKTALRHNAGAAIFAHNHPSGICEPSHADECLTQSLTTALALVDVKVLDHFIVAGGATLSFAERGLI